MRGNRRKRNRRHGGSSVWRSYADMMSGLLLLFVLIMAVCLMQAQKNYTEKLAEQAKLLKSQAELEQSQSELEQSQAKLSEQQTVLEQQESELENQKTALASQEEAIRQQESELSSQEMTLAEQAKMLEDLQAALESQKLDLDQKESEMDEANAVIAQKESELSQNQEELDEATDKLLESQIKLDENQAKLEESQKAVENSQKKLDEANELMAVQQEKIDQIIGVKAELVEQLNQEFKRANVNVQVDKETGAILLDSSVLYEFGKSDLTEEGKEILDEILPVYCVVLLSGTHSDDIGEIIIDGYTDSVGEYKRNLQLSQARAFAVAEYLLDDISKALRPDEVENLRAKLSVNGKSSSNPILTETGEEDSDASRRVEIKFRLKDEEMIEELQNLIEEGQSTANTASAPESETQLPIAPLQNQQEETKTEE